jgi:hypothetical protein
MEAWWEEVSGSALLQGDLLRDCVVPIMPANFEPPHDDEAGEYRFTAEIYDLIVVTQSCDLEQNKVPVVATCPIF